MTSPFVLPSASGSYFVAINPNTDALDAIPLAEGSSDILFAVFGQGSAVDFNTSLVNAQESLGISVTNRRTWMLHHGDSTTSDSLLTLLNH